MSLFFLIGHRGCGKTTVGKALANILSYSFVDLDDYLCQKEQKSIQTIVAHDGWRKFRILETQYLLEVSSNYNNQAIISTGGGIVCNAFNREHMRKAGFVIWLKANADILHNRLLNNNDQKMRPALTNLDMMAEIKQTLNERIPLYQNCAHFEVDAMQNINAVCLDILSFIEKT